MNDPYTDDFNVLKRIVKEYQEHGKLIVAVDFDGTINDFHNEGYKFPRVREVLHKCNIHNFTVIAFTANKDHETVYKGFNDLAIKIDGINMNVLPQFEGSGKIYYNILLDDRAGLSSSLYVLEMFFDIIEGIRL